MKRCTRCIRPESHASINFDLQGVCNFCRTFETRHRRVLKSPSTYYAEKKVSLQNAIEKERARGSKYQALLGLSGGKDSAYALYLMKEKLGANVFCYTMDSHFYASAAKANVERIVKEFGTDHVWIPGPSVELFRHFFMKTGRLCYICNLGIVHGIHALARQHNIRIVVTGYSVLTDGIDPEGTSPWLVKNVVKDGAEEPVYREGMRIYRESLKYMLDLLLGRLKLYNLGEYFEWNDDDIRTMFKQKYDIEFGTEHSDCELHDLAGLCAIRKYGFTLNMSKWSKHILLGRMSREEAMRRIEQENALYLNPKGEIGESMTRAMQQLNLSDRDIEQAFQNNDQQYRKGLLNLAMNYYRRKFYA